jgi:GNAT superfamily N-acetyltransferase
MTYELRPVVTEAEWRAMHDIRRATLFAPGRHAHEVVYDENHPHDRVRGHQPFLLTLDSVVIGVVRLDQRGEEGGVVRLVAIIPALQKRGHGRKMGELVEAVAHRRGMRKLHVNAHRSAVGFYLATGWREENWDESELVGLASDCVQMTKVL